MIRIILCLFAFAACCFAQELPTVTPTVTVTATLTATPTATTVVTPTRTATATPTPTAPPRASMYSQVDFSGDGLSEAGVVGNQRDGSPNELYSRMVNTVNGEITYVEFGNNGNAIAHGDYDGDGYWDFGEVITSLPNELRWRIRSGRTGVITEFSFGIPTDIIVSGCDFDGDFRTDFAVISGEVLKIRNGVTGWEGAVPVPVNASVIPRFVECADLDGDLPQELVLITQERVAQAKGRPSGRAARRRPTPTPRPPSLRYMLSTVDSAGGVTLQQPADKPLAALAADANGDGIADPGYMKAGPRNISSLQFIVYGSLLIQRDVAAIDAAAACMIPRDGIRQVEMCVLRGSAVSFYDAVTAADIPAGTLTGEDLLRGARLTYTGGITPEDPDRVCALMQDARDGANGFLWKASDAHGGTLVVLLPSKFRKFKRVSVMKDGAVLDTLKFSGIANGNRQHWRSAKRARSFPDQSIVVAYNRGGNFCWRIGKAARRND